MWRRVRNKTGPLFQGVIYRWAWLWLFGFSLSLSLSKTYFPQIPGLMEVVQGHNALSSPPLCHCRAWWTHGQLSHLNCRDIFSYSEFWWSLGM